MHATYVEVKRQHMVALSFRYVSPRNQTVGSGLAVSAVTVKDNKLSLRGTYEKLCVVPCKRNPICVGRDRRITGLIAR